jgi:protein O-GlcNAc transferase
MPEVIPSRDHLDVCPSRSRHTGALLARMLVTPVWRWPEAPSFDALENSLWETYAHWAFTAPGHFSSESMLLSWSTSLTAHVEQLAHWTLRNRAAASVRAAVTRFLAHLPRLPLVLIPTPPRELAAAIGHILSHNLRLDHTQASPLTLPGSTRRVAFVLPSLSDSPAARGLWPLVEQLDTAWEAEFIVEEDAWDDLALRFQQLGRPITVLPTSPLDQVRTVRELGLDALVFASPLATAPDALTRLALHRLAPLQAALPGPLGTTGLPEIDLLIVGEAEYHPDLTARLTERLGLLPGLGGLCLPASPDPDAATLTREELGLPESAFVFAAAVPLSVAPLEAERIWAHLLATKEDTLLLVAIIDAIEEQSISTVARELDLLWASREINPRRVQLIAAGKVHATQRGRLLACTDVIIDTGVPWPVASTADLLARGGLVATIRGASLAQSTTAALLHTLQGDALVARDAGDLIARLANLARQANLGRTARQAIARELSGNPAHHDSLAAGLALADLLTLARQTMIQQGRRGWTRSTDTLSPATGVALETELCTARQAWAANDAPTAIRHARRALQANSRHLEARLILGRASLQIGEGETASRYLLAAIGDNADDDQHWYELAQALHRAGRPSEAIEALETSLRINEHHRIGWEFLATLAAAVGADELAAAATLTAAQCPGERVHAE